MKLITKNERAWLDLNANTGTPSTLGSIATASQAVDVPALTDSSTGTSGGNTIAAVTNPTFAWNGATYPSAAEGTAVNSAITALKNAVATLAAKNNAMRTALVNAGIML